MTCSTSEVAVCCSSDLGELARALLLGLKQPHVLDGDHRLVGERPEKRNLLIRKRINFGTSKLNCADRHPLA